MGPDAVSLVVVVALSLTAALTGPTVVHAEGNRACDNNTPKNTTRQDDQCCSIQRRQDLTDARLDGLDTRLSKRYTRLNDLMGTRQNEFDTRLNRIDVRLDQMDTAMSDMKEYLQEWMAATDKLLALALAGTNSQQEVTTALPDTTSGEYRGCQEALMDGGTTSGVYTIAPDGVNPINVSCEQTLDGGGWTVLQARYDGSVDFYQDWNTYKTGFGSLSGEFWLGNENIYQLTKNHDQQLKIELTSPEGEVKYADYGHFWVAGQSEKYRLTVTGFFTGDMPPGDAMAIHNGQQFSTRDQDNDRSRYEDCAEQYNHCHNANLNGRFGSSVYGQGMNWYQWKGDKVSMKATRMMMRKRS